MFSRPVLPQGSKAPRVGALGVSPYVLLHSTSIPRAAVAQMAFSLTVARSGPGILVAWPAVAGAEAYIVSRARRESLSFHPLETGCCPEVRRVSPQPDFDLPCCPVAPSRTSLQVEGLEPGMSYRFHVLAVGTTNVSSASSEPSAPHDLAIPLNATAPRCAESRAPT